MPKRVLVVDDHTDTRIICRELLTHFGYVVDEAEHGAAALERSQVNQPDLVLLDFLMPERDGLQVLTELRSRPETAATPIVLYTAAAARLGELYDHPHVTRVLLKPVQATQLLRMVQELIGPAEIPA
jgi:CheY-like chemotaxis protein